MLGPEVLGFAYLAIGVVSLVCFLVGAWLYATTDDKWLKNLQDLDNNVW